jgi:SAM-dependent methyltransferase
MENIKSALEIFDYHALEYQKKFMDVSLYGDTFDLFCEHIKIKNPSILELACGPGNITRYLLKKRPDFKLLGIDFSANMVALARMNNPTADFIVMDCRKTENIEQKFDGIICGFCLPYLTSDETLKLIDDASKLLHPGGVLYLSTIEDQYSKSGLQTNSAGDQTMMYYYEADQLSHALTECGFRIITLMRKNYPSVNDKMVTDLIIIAEKSKL